MQNMELEIQVWRGQELVSTEVLDPGSYTIGRSPTCDIVLHSPEVSRRHAHLEFRDDSW
jgi:pSer/pThr/pTyr-binding forkhead associated (FHA) protein